jgi:hypothetical protein
MSYQRESVPAEKRLETVAAGIIVDLKAWAAACPRYRKALHDCIEEIAWEARLRPAFAPEDPRPHGLKYGAKEIVTALTLWAELNPRIARHLLACVEEISLIAEQHERARPNRRARDEVVDALTAGYRTCPQIAEYKGLPLRTVQYAVQRLVRLKLVSDVGCAAKVREDGCRLRLYELTHTPA